MGTILYVSKGIDTFTIESDCPDSWSSVLWRDVNGEQKPFYRLTPDVFWYFVSQCEKLDDQWWKTNVDILEKRKKLNDFKKRIQDGAVKKDNKVIEIVRQAESILSNQDIALDQIESRCKAAAKLMEPVFQYANRNISREQLQEAMKKQPSLPESGKPFPFCPFCHDGLLPLFQSKVKRFLE